MKKQTKNRLFKLLGIGACSFVLGLSACSSNYYYGDHSEETKQYDYVEKRARKNITYDESTYTITYSFQDFSNQDNLNNILNTLYDNGYTDSSNALTINGVFTLSSSHSGSGVTVPSGDYTVSSLYVLQSSQGGTPIKTLKFIGVNGSNYSISIGYTSNYFCSISYQGPSVSANDEPSSFVITSETYYNLFEPQAPSDDMPQVLTDFMSLLVGGIQSLAVGIAQGVASMASALFLNVDNGAVTGLSTFGGIIAIFAGIALAVGITTRVYLWITRLGKD